MPLQAVFALTTTPLGRFRGELSRPADGHDGAITAQRCCGAGASPRPPSPRRRTARRTRSPARSGTPGRQLGGSLSIVQWTHVIAGTTPGSTPGRRTGGPERRRGQVDLEHYTRLPALVATEAKAQQGTRHRRLPGAADGLRGPGDRPRDDRPRGRARGRPVRRAGPAEHLQPADDERTSASPTRTSRPPHLAARPLERGRRVARDVGARPRAAPTLKAAGTRSGSASRTSRTRTSPCSPSDVLRLVPPGRVQRPRDRQPGDGRGGAVHGRSPRRGGQTDEVFGWNEASNNQFVFSGRGSLIVNAISAVRLAEDLQLPVADDLWIWPLPAGPHGRLALPQSTSVYSIWKFAKNREAAEKFLADLCIAAEQATLASKLFNFPSFPGAFPPERSTRPRPPTRTVRTGSTRSSRRSRRGTRAMPATRARRMQPSTKCSTRFLIPGCSPRSRRES